MNVCIKSQKNGFLLLIYLNDNKTKDAPIIQLNTVKVWFRLKRSDETKTKLKN